MSGRGERGSVTVVAAAVIAVVVVITMGAADVGKALIARARAEQAADAAALAAAQELALPSGREPAEVAGDYAARNGGVLAGCTCAAGTPEAIVEVTVPVGPFLLVPGTREVTAQARAVLDLPGSPSPPPLPG